MAAQCPKEVLNLATTESRTNIRVGGGKVGSVVWSAWPL